MNPDDLKLAREECAALLKQGLIEPTKSEWACQAFYVEKRSEIKGWLDLQLALLEVSDRERGSETIL